MVVGRTLPPTVCTVRFGCASKMRAIGSVLVITVRLERVGKFSARAVVVEPASNRMAPSVGTRSAAATAMRRFSALKAVRVATLGS